MKKWFKNNFKRIIATTCMVVAMLALCSCASCQRACKDYNSEIGNGLYRTVKVYTYDGELVAEYTGKFDIETDHSTYILWDDEMGKRHIIYFTNFNIIIDEN